MGLAQHDVARRKLLLVPQAAIHNDAIPMFASLEGFYSLFENKRLGFDCSNDHFFTV